MRKNMVNIWAITHGTRALGPGNRVAIWTQGCLKRCPGCTSPESRPLEDHDLRTPEALASEILGQEGIDGITVSGGEPFLQAGPLAETLSLVRKERPGMTVIVFTGYLCGELVWDEARTLLRYVDVLIDGPFVKAKKTGRGLRGSTNQEIHFLTDRLLPWKEVLLNGPRILETTISEDGIVTVGIPTYAFPISFTESNVQHQNQQNHV